MLKLPSLAVAITFFFDPRRLEFLGQITRHYSKFADDFKVFVITDTNKPRDLDLIASSLQIGNKSLEIVTPPILGHPMLLAWIHREIFRKEFEADKYTHFLYTEDDLELTAANVKYWLRSRASLKPHGLVPSFLRYEVSPTGLRVSSDALESHHFRDLPRVRLQNDWFLNVGNPYQGMYLMDQSLMSEFLSSKSFSPDSSDWKPRETASQGLIFEKIPPGFWSRNVLRYSPENGLDPASLVRHLPNNYAHNSSSRFGKIAVADLISEKRPYIPLLLRKLTTVVRLQKPRRGAEIRVLD